MNDTAQTPLWRRLRFTPLRDLVRGKVTGRLDVRSQIAAAALPESARSLVQRVVKRTRLWRIEKAAVADELIAHFLDGLEAGQPVEELISTFGDEKQSAKLIRRAKVRNRPLIWHGYKWLRRGLVAMLVLYGLLAIPFFLQHPSPSVDYVAQLNAITTAYPESDHGWPLYRQALLALMDTLPPSDNGNTGPWTRNQPTKDFPDWICNSPNGQDWPEMEPWLRKHQSDIDLIRQGTTRPVFGFVLGPKGSISHEKYFQGHFPIGSAEHWNAEQILIEVPLPYLNDARALAGALRCDSKLALLDHDSARLERDLVAPLQLATQIRRSAPFLVSNLVAIGIDNLGLDAMRWILAEHPDALSDEQWIRVAHQLSGSQVPADLISFSSERMYFKDTLQRIYTDDGQGDGHLTAAGMRFLSQIAASSQKDTAALATERVLQNAFGPAMMAASASRKQMMLVYNQIMDAAEANLHCPTREVDTEELDRRIAQVEQSAGGRIRYSVVATLVPSLNRVGVSAERSLAHRDGLKIGIALELYHRRHGRYPATLDKLSPQLLPTVPVDRITGQPLKYKLVGGKPLIYSVGADRVDDGGVGVLHDGKVINYDEPAVWGHPTEPGKLRGDWILYPRPEILNDGE